MRITICRSERMRGRESKKRTAAAAASKIAVRCWVVPKSKGRMHRSRSRPNSATNAGLRKTANTATRDFSPNLRRARGQLRVAARNFTQTPDSSESKARASRSAPAEKYTIPVRTRSASFSVKSASLVLFWLSFVRTESGTSAARY